MAIYAPEWIYKTFGGLSELDALIETNKLHINNPPEGYELKIDMEKEPIKPTYLGKTPEKHTVYQDEINPIQFKEIMAREEFNPKKSIRVKRHVYEAQKWGISSWVESRRTEEPKVSIGRWKSYYWYQWQEVTK